MRVPVDWPSQGLNQSPSVIYISWELTCATSKKDFTMYNNLSIQLKALLIIKSGRNHSFNKPILTLCHKLLWCGHSAILGRKWNIQYPNLSGRDFVTLFWPSLATISIFPWHLMVRWWNWVTHFSTHGLTWYKL